MLRCNLANSSTRKYATAVASKLSNLKTQSPEPTVKVQNQTPCSIGTNVIDDLVSYKTSNNLNLVSIPNSENATSSLLLLIKAGSRFETTSGVSHVLNRFAFKSTANKSSLRICRESEYLGGMLDTHLSREYLLLSAKFLRQDLSYYIDLFGEILQSSKLFPHEYYEQVIPQCTLDIHKAEENTYNYALDLLHQCAFRRGLGNSLYVDSNYLPSLSQVRDFAEKVFNQNNIVLLGGGVEPEGFYQLATQRFGKLHSGNKLDDTIPSTFHTGSIRKSHKAAKNCMMIGLNSSEISPAEQIVLSHLFGGATRVKWSTGSGILGPIASNFNGTSVSTEFATYSDASLIYVTIMSDRNNSFESISSVIQAIKTKHQTINEDDLKKAKMQAKFSLLSAFENDQKVLALSGASILAKNSLPNVNSLIHQIETLSFNDIQKSYRKIVHQNNIATVALGELSKIPYFDEI